MFLLCQDGQNNDEWYVLSASQDRLALDDKAEQLNADDFKNELQRWVDRNKTGHRPLPLDDPSREGYRKFYVVFVKDWPAIMEPF